MSVSLFELAPQARINFTKMVFIYEESNRVKLKLNEPKSLITVINSSLERANQQYKSYFTHFLQSLTKSELKALVKDGAKIYRGALVPPESAEQKARPVNSSVTYRGVQVAAQPRPAVSTGDRGGDAKSAGGKRVYRGVILDDE